MSLAPVPFYQNLKAKLAQANLDKLKHYSRFEIVKFNSQLRV